MSELRDEAGFAGVKAFFGAGHGADPTLEHDLDQALTRTFLAGGEVLFERGAPGDAMYVVATGRLRVLGVIDDDAVTLAEIGPGQPTGEMAVLTGEPRQATVIAVRDSVVFGLGRDNFDRLLEKYPGAMRGLLTEFAQRMNKPPIVGRNALRPRNIAIVGAGENPKAAVFADALASFFREHASIAWVDRPFVEDALGLDADAGQGSDLAAAMTAEFDRLELEHEFVLYVADPQDSAWTQRCLRQADLVLAVGDATERPTITSAEQGLFGRDASRLLARVELVLLQPHQDRSPVDTRHWLESRDVDMVHHVHLERRSHFSRLARFIVGQPVGLVLSGGSARAFAHIGVLRALREADIPIDIIVGTSAGALIGGQYARGWDDERLERENIAMFSRSRRLLDFTIPHTSIISSAKFNEVLDKIFGNIRFEDLWIQFLCTTTDMTAAELRTHRRGELRRAVRASCSLPMLMPPVVEDGRLLADGGIMNNVPVDQLLAVANVGSLIVVNVTNPFYTADEEYNYDNSLPFWRVFNGRFNPFSQSLVAPGIMQVLMRSLEIGTKSLERDQIAKADVYVRPDVGDVPYTDASGLPGTVQAGYIAAQRQLADWDPEIPFR